MNLPHHSSNLSTDTFWLDMLVRHPNWNAQAITDALDLEPIFASSADSTHEPHTKQTTIWFTRLFGGRRQEDFDRELNEFAAILDSHAAFLKKLIFEGGEVELILNERIVESEGIVLTLKLPPFFLKALARHGAGLQLQAWNPHLNPTGIVN